MEHSRGNENSSPLWTGAFVDARKYLPEGTTFPDNEEIRHLVSQVVEEKVPSLPRDK